ncbi:rhomboid-related protein 4 [Hypanus sabinus]|uniref:rhomboid-related protein 4 n=1 Tax=Hypanus sabinus TaxID=79690 RepID=UPI0028C465E9|nr:rhomboid-related protein 4 [Hypanus sabinus]XP_059799713.1 rhomboid-related protein 4 [Hypanus sabinus]XP_059799717.1 rhomboid-related protein 4 [Hypanus sabinus]XP_059799721.1 rhomboid-related protein 4 [Hypanus sabinus]
MYFRRRRDNLGLLLLLVQLFQVGFENIPPVTLITIALNVFLFLSPMKPLLDVCISVRETWNGQDWKRLIYSPFHHADDWHLYFNMVSMLYKGIRLEQRLGRIWFAYLLSVFSVMIGIVYLILEVALAELMDEPNYRIQCAVGFSGVLFALKVLNGYYNPGGVTYMMGIPVWQQYACWVELVAIHLLAPGSSFVGHLSGIIVGLLYVKGPLKSIMQACADIVSSSNYPRQQTRFTNQGYSGYSSSSYDTSYDRTGFTGGMTEAEQLDAAIWASLNNHGAYGDGRRPYGFRDPEQLNEEEIRQRRINRFAR